MILRFSRFLVVLIATAGNLTAISIMQESSFFSLGFDITNKPICVNVSSGYTYKFLYSNNRVVMDEYRLGERMPINSYTFNIKNGVVFSADIDGMISGAFIYRYGSDNLINEIRRFSSTFFVNINFHWDDRGVEYRTNMYGLNETKTETRRYNRVENNKYSMMLNGSVAGSIEFVEDGGRVIKMIDTFNGVTTTTDYTY